MGVTARQDAAIFVAALVETLVEKDRDVMAGLAALHAGLLLMREDPDRGVEALHICEAALADLRGVTPEEVEVAFREPLRRVRESREAG